MQRKQGAFTYKAPSPDFPVIRRALALVSLSQMTSIFEFHLD